MNIKTLLIGFPIKLFLTICLCIATSHTLAASPLNINSATASSAIRAANFAVDGDQNTRWESSHNVDPSYLTLDFGQTYTLSQAVISWEAANAKTYDILGSTNGSTWTTLSQQTNGVFGERIDTVSLSGNYRYLRIQGSSRSDGNQWGYSIWEVEIYGDEVTDIPNDDLSGKYFIQNIGTGKYVKSSDANLYGGVEVTTNNNDALTTWTLTKQDDYYFISNLSTGYKIRPINANDDSALYMVPSSWTGSWTQWNITESGDGYRLTNNASGKFIRPTSSSNNTMKQVPTTYTGTWTQYRLIATDGTATPTPTPTATPTATPTPSATPTPITGAPVALFNNSTALEPATQEETSTALITRFSDRPRTRHAREDQYQSYDHYVAFYFENRSSNIEIIDTVAKGGSSITMNVRTLWPLSDTEAENRWWYYGQNTVAHYAGNGVMTYLGFDGTHYNYTKSDSTNRQFNREIRIGDRLEFEISQFSRDDIPRGQVNYYGTTFLYIVGEGIVPWYTENAGEFVEGLEPFQEDSRKIPEAYWLGGHTTLSYQYTDEPNDHFIQMATNLGYDNGQTFLLGRRVHHSSAIDGTHDESAENGVYDDMVNKTGTHYVNESCVDCHTRNGSAPVASNGVLLDKWIFKIGDSNGNPTANMGRVLQPKNASGTGEGNVSISSWTESGGLRKPNYQFSNGTPAQFSARIAPRLVGIGLLEAIPESTILALADPEDSNGDGISGRASLVTDPADGFTTRLGRFGWKAATSSVKHQVAAALNTDMGVMTSLLSTPDCGSAQSDCNSNNAPLADEELDNLVTYISLLGVRAQRGWESGTENTTIVSGKQIFNNINCNSCHVETLQTSPYHPHAELRDQTIHPYTDLLVHDMGPGLADNLAEGEVSGSEWRTTPLWGLGLSACVTGGVTNPTGYEGDEVCTPHHAYLHDGRARSIEEAILWHGGEAEASTNAYKALSTNNKNALLAFLNSL